MRLLWTCQEDSTWHDDLKALGYSGFEGGPIPSPACQIVIATIDCPEFHMLVIELDNQAAENTNSDGTPPMLIDLLAFDDWVKLAGTCLEDLAARLEKLRKVHSLLPQFVIDDEAGTEEAAKLKELLARAFSLSLDTHTETPYFKEEGTFEHPLANKRCRSSEGMKNILSRTSHKNNKAHLQEQCPVPSYAPCDIETDVGKWNHRIWAGCNVNLLAPMSVETWQRLGHLSEVEVIACRDRALNDNLCIANPMHMGGGLEMSMFDINCIYDQPMTGRCKGHLQTKHKRKEPERHVKEFWNWNRPFVKCACEHNAAPKGKKGKCNAGVLWFDHMVYYMANNLDLFFADEPTLELQWSAFLVFLTLQSNRELVKAQITFIYIREMIMKAAKQFAKDEVRNSSPSAGPRYIEKLIKPVSRGVCH